MTQKSENRKQRDLAKAAEAGKIKEEGRRGWDEVMTLSNEVLALLAFPTALVGPLKNKPLISHLTKDEGLELAASVRLLQKDMTTMLEKFKVIRAKHEKKSGYEADMNEVMQGYELVNEYVHFQAEYDAFILPTQADITNWISIAENRMMALMAKQNAETAEVQPAAETATA